MPANVLVVEDEQLVGADIRSHLERLGYGVPGIMATGEEALRSASECQPDLVLMDIQLKGRLDGIETARIMQSRFNVPVIYVTAFADEATLRRAKGTEPYGYVLKPFGAKELQTAVELALHKRSRERHLKSNERWVMGLVNSLPAGIIAIQSSGLVCFMNLRAEQLTGMRLEDAAGSDWQDAISFTSKVCTPMDCPVRKALRDNVTTDLLDVTAAFPKTGKQATIVGVVSPMTEQDGDSAAIVLFRDVTLGRRLEDEYRRARHLEDMQRLAGALAHQFSNFITLISGYAESLARSLDQADPRLRDVRTIQKGSERASLLTRELMAFSRAQTLNAKLLDANQAIANLCDVLKVSIGPTTKLDAQFGAGVGKIEADPMHLEQILMTLVMNARDAMPDDGIVTLRTSAMDVDESLAGRFVDLAAGQYVRIDVADTGTGMSYEAQTHIFEPFFTTKDRARGAAGLGLATAYGMVKQNRGHIWFESEPHKGTVFSVCLPRADAAHSEASLVARNLRGSETVLLVEDDREERSSIRDTLLELGYRVIECTHGSEALKICEQQHIDVVFSNIIMPNMTGYELANRLARVRPSTKVMFMSDYSEYALRQHGATVPGSTLLQKPFSPSVLARTLRRVLGPPLTQ